MKPEASVKWLLASYWKIWNKKEKSKMKHIIEKLRKLLSSPENDSSEQILEMFDKSYERCEFPLLDTFSHWSFGKIRCNVYMSDDEWLIMFDMLAYYPGQGNYDNAVYVYGNRIKKNGFQHYQGEERNWENIERLLNQYSVRIPEDFNDWFPSRNDFTVRINGKKTSFSVTDSEYKSAGIDIARRLSGDEQIDTATIILRYLVDKLYVDDLFYPDEFLFNYIGREFNLEPFLKLDDWIHPDGKIIKLPGESTSFQMLAKAIVEKNPGQHQFSDGNTQWRNRADYIHT